MNDDKAARLQELRAALNAVIFSSLGPVEYGLAIYDSDREVELFSNITNHPRLSALLKCAHELSKTKPIESVSTQ